MSSCRSPAWKNAVFSIYAETVAAERVKAFSEDPTLRIQKGNYKRETTVIRDSVRAWYLANRGILTNPGAGIRGKSSVAASHFVRISSVVFEDRPKGNFLLSAVANAF